MTRAKHIFDYYPITEKIQMGSWEHGISRAIEKSPGSSKREVDVLGMIKKKSYRLSVGHGFWVLEFRRGGAQFFGIYRGESLFSNCNGEKSINSKAFFQKSVCILSPTTL